MKIFVILASYNRRQFTMQALADIYTCARRAALKVEITLSDDASNDGTPEAVAEHFPKVNLLSGDGNYFWARSMQAAEEYVMTVLNPQDGDALIWMNDDIKLDESAFERILDIVAVNQNKIVVGAMREPGGTATTYGGFVRAGLHPLRLALVQPDEHRVKKVDRFNGNLVAIPFAVAKQVGEIDGGYSHALADIDYGARASAVGVTSLLAPGSFGECSRNPMETFPTIRAEWCHFISSKGGGNPHSLQRYLKKNNTRTWWIFLTITYTKWWIRAVGQRLKRTHLEKAKSQLVGGS